MEPKRSAKQGIIRKAYVRLVLVNIVALIATNICVFIDNIMITRFLDPQALAAVGYFSPMTAVTGLAYILILGTLVVSGNYIGAGRQDKVNALFANAFRVITVGCAVFSMLLMAGRGPLAALLGARDEPRALLEDYVLGFAPSIVFSSLTAFLMSLAAYNNEINRSYVATGAMFFGNILFDAALVGPLGILGIGLASTLSSLASFLIMLPGFVKNTKTVHLSRARLDAKLLWEAARRGIPALMFTGGMLVKNSLINYALTVYVGYKGIAVATVLGSFCGVVGALTGGCTNAYSALASLYYGAEDREGIIRLSRIALGAGTVGVSILVAIIAVLSVPITGFFFKTGTDIWALGRGMFVLGFLFFPFNLIVNLLMNSYKAQGRMALVNVVTLLETAMIGVIAVLTAPAVGVNGVWLANTWSDLLSLAIIVVSVIVWKKHMIGGLADVLMLPDDFGAADDEYVEYSVDTIEEALAASQSVIGFCESKGIDHKRALMTGLCVEEMTCNVLQHGATDGGKHFVSVRVVCKGGLTIAVQDDCVKFDPRERMKLYDPEAPEKNVGLRTVGGIAQKIDYYNNAGINTLIIKV